MPICQKHQTEMKTIIFNPKGGSPFSHDYCEECEKGIEEREKQKTLEIEKAQREYYLERRNDGIPPRFWDSNLSDFSNMQTINHWLNNPNKSLYITGPCGTGKTRLAAALAYNLRDNKKNCSFVIASNLFLQLRNSFNSDDKNERDIINKYSSPDFAIFDDIGAQKISDYVIEAWYNIIDSRYGKMLPTIFTSNMTLSEISAFMSDRIASRIASGIIFELMGEDRRLTK